MIPQRLSEDVFAQILNQVRIGRPGAAERKTRWLLEHFPRDVNLLWLLGLALLDQGRTGESLVALESALAAAPDFSEALVDIGRLYRRVGRLLEARAAVHKVLETNSQHHRAWLAYGDTLVDLGELEAARTAFERARLTQPAGQQIEQATHALLAKDYRHAETLFRGVLQRDGAHVGALCGLAGVSLEADHPEDSERLLRHALRQSAYDPLIYRALAPTLVRLGKLTEASGAAEHLRRLEPANPQSWVTTASVAIRMLRQEEALDAYERAIRLEPSEVGLHLSLGHVQKTLGRRPESESSYKHVLTMKPDSGEAYWSLADLKNYRFTDQEVANLQRFLAGEGGERSNRALLHFALGKALEQRAQYPEAFRHYSEGNRLRRAEAPFDIDGFERRCARIRSYFDRSFFARHSGTGVPLPDPIFIVGLPRSGSTLLEQILASHSMVDGTMELPNILNIVANLDDRDLRLRQGYPETLEQMSSRTFGELGQRYLEETAPLRAGRIRFTDKMPNNFSHIGLIHAMLPRATIIDARRNPMDTCFSAYKQHFAAGQTFSNDLQHLGRYYRCYLELMDHWDAVLPGKVLRVQYEHMVRDPEGVIRKVLAHCGLPFETGCLSFHSTRRSVRTSSAEQVRQPIYTSSLAHWRNFESQLQPLRAALGNALDRFERDETPDSN